MAIDQLPAVTVKGPQGGDMAGDLYLGGLPGLCVVLYSFLTLI